MGGRTITIVVVVLVVLCLVAALGAVAYWYFMVPTAEAETKPTVEIDTPLHGDEVVVGRGVQVIATGRDPGKIARLELWVDQQMMQSQASALPGGTSPFFMMFMWTPEAPGNHIIVVRAYNMANASGQASISVSAVDAPQVPEGCPGLEVFEHTVQAGETLEGIAGGYGVTVDDILACNPGLDPTAMPQAGTGLLVPAVYDPEGQGPPPDWPLPAGAEELPGVPEDLEELPGAELPPPEEEPPPGEEPPPDVEQAPEGGVASEEETPEVPTVTLGFEALYFEVDQAYDGIYCMVQLADYPMERIPEVGSFYKIGGPYWDIQAELAGINSRQVAVQGDTVRVEAECFGWVGINGWSLGHFVKEHPEAEWRGEEIEVQALADDGRWFRVVYRICPGFPCEPMTLPAPTNLHAAKGCPCVSCPPCSEVYGIGWDWTGDEAEIDRFELARNNPLQLLYAGDPSARWMAIDWSQFTPPCGEHWTYQLFAGRGPVFFGLYSPPSNPLKMVGPPCTATVVVKFDTLSTGCMRPDPCNDISCMTCKMDAWTGMISANDQFYLQPETQSPWLNTDINTAAVIPVKDLFGNDTFTEELDLAAGEDLSIHMMILDWDPGWGYLNTLHGVKVIDGAAVTTGDYQFEVKSEPEGYGYGIVKIHVEVLPSGP